MSRMLSVPLIRWLSRLRYPKLFVVIAALFVVDLAIPNFVPWDDILLGLGTLMLGRWKSGSFDPPATHDGPGR